MIRLLRWSVSGLCAVVLSSVALRAQGSEPEFLAAAAKQLDAHATRCFKAKYPLRAKEVWSEVLRDYDQDDAAAREALGFLRVGASWAPDSRFTYPTSDEPDPAVARILQKSWETLAKELGEGHRGIADAMQKDGMADRARYHYERTLRFLPSDPSAIAASGRRNVEGLFGSDLELALLERSRRIDRSVTRQLETDHAVAPVPSGTTQKLLERAKVPYRGFESEHFRIWGDWSDETLIECAKHAERALAVCNELYEGIAEYRWPKPKDRFQLAFFTTRATWETVLRANSDQFQGNSMDFVIANTSATGLGAGADEVRVCGFENAPSCHDMSVRAVAQAYAAVGADALDEGIGHAVVGWFFGRNLIFSVAQARDDGRTTTDANRTAKFALPDLSVWGELAVEIAWERTDTPAAKLPLIKASDFSSEDRIKSWAFCDYLLRRDPLLLKKLNAQSARGNSNLVTTGFAEATGGLQLTALDDDWRRFWTDDTPILRAIRNKQTPLESISKKAPEFLEEFNDIRKLYGRGVVSWSSQYSAECKQHADYLLMNKGERGPAAEHTQDTAKKGGSLGGRQFANLALVSTTAKAANKTFADWLDLPGFRDAILNDTLTMVGIYVESTVLVMDVTRGQTGGQLKIGQFPLGVAPGTGLGQNAPPGVVVPTDVEFADLGPEVADAFARVLGKKKPGKRVGYPISLHFFRNGALPAASSLRCVLRADDKVDVPGVLHIGDGGTCRRSSAPGLVVFYPFEPLKRGAAFTVEWSFAKGGKQESLPKYQFFTR